MARPKIFKNVKEVEDKINDYFEYCKKEEKPYTMSGLAYYLGIDRKTLLNYSKDEQFFPTIKKARDRVQMQLEEYLYRLGNNSGVIFNLKNNFGWKDTVEEKHMFNNGVLDDLLGAINDAKKD